MSSDSIKLFIASAGLGSRLRPVTEAFPKPLLPLAGLNLVERLVYSVMESCHVDQLAMNLHYRPEDFKAWAKDLPDCFPKPQFFYESELLGTGGAIANAKNFFEDSAVLLINGDILTDIDWQGLVQAHKESGNLVTLAVQDRAHERRVGVDGENKLVCIDKEMKASGVTNWMGYACAVIYEPEFLNYLPEGESHVVPFWVDAARETGRVGTYDIGTVPWLDLGNVNTYAEGAFRCLGNNERYLAEPLKTPWDLNLSGRCIIEADVEIGESVSLCESILLPGAKIASGESLKNVVAGPDFRVAFDAVESVKCGLHKTIGEGGSDRQYFRMKEAVLLQYSPFEVNAERQEILTDKLLNSGLRVPQVLKHNKEARQMLLEDLGDATFRQWALQRNEIESLEMSKKILSQLVDFQFVDCSGLDIPYDKEFDEGVLLWESSYFIERCVCRLFAMANSYERIKVALGAELKKLAQEVAALPRGLMHRDFQSDNIMIKNNQPWFIDFQGAHHGTPFYDAASFIGDPYRVLDREVRNDLEIYYLELLCPRLEMSADAGRRGLLICGMQRHMQALGAYGFLSTIRGKERYKAYVKPALDLLQEEVHELKQDFPVLNDLVSSLVNQTHG